MSETTLRDALTNALDAQEAAQVETVEPIAQIEETSEQRADRIRDEAGRFKAKEEGAAPVAVEPVIQAAPPRKPPASWKKDYWEAYEKLDPKLAEYIDTREQQFASGVSTYKQEAERAKEMFEALAPIQGDLQQNGISPAKWIRDIGIAHQTLVRGTPEQKLQAFHKLAQDYKVPLNALLDPNVRQQFINQAPQTPAPDVGKLVEDKFVEYQAKSETERFASDPANVHFEAVKETMGQLLGAGLATDLKGAYDKAVRMNDEIWQAEQQRQTGDAEKQRREAEAARVAKARANTVSTKSATPIGAMGSSGKKDLRSTLEEAADAMLGGARV